jgi:hypothetical protein
VLLAPLLWIGVGTLLLEPHSQRWLALFFTDGSDPVLMVRVCARTGRQPGTLKNITQELAFDADRQPTTSQSALLTQ